MSASMNSDTNPCAFPCCGDNRDDKRENVKSLNRREIVELARKARLIFKDADSCYLNDVATEKELITFVRLIEDVVRSRKPTA